MITKSEPRRYLWKLLQFEKFPADKQQQCVKALSSLIGKSPRLYFALPFRLQRESSLVGAVLPALKVSAQQLRLDLSVPTKRFHSSTQDLETTLRDHCNFTKLILPAARFTENGGTCNLALLSHDLMRTIGEFVGIQNGEKLRFYRGMRPVVEFLRNESIWDEYGCCLERRLKDSKNGDDGGVQVRDMDTLLGRGTRANRHPGNNMMRLVVRFLRTLGYAGKESGCNPKEKRELATVIVNTMAAECSTLFLKIATNKQDHTETVTVVEKCKAIEKVMQCFREKWTPDPVQTLRDLSQDAIAHLVALRTIQILYPDQLESILSKVAPGFLPTKTVSNDDQPHLRQASLPLVTTNQTAEPNNQQPERCESHDEDEVAVADVLSNFARRTQTHNPIQPPAKDVPIVSSSMPSECSFSSRQYPSPETNASLPTPRGRIVSPGTALSPLNHHYQRQPQPQPAQISYFYKTTPQSPTSFNSLESSLESLTKDESSSFGSGASDKFTRKRKVLLARPPLKKRHKAMALHRTTYFSSRD
eukprot:CAMPEP_0116546410 /NCGR_PEP_ID=MMETSP0397-20121206/3213_1 /TAXON_ID=216820 /ORGANISM="Cyclophora tenuis, Strain ECT3854" /LENGTH=530 /DNA_ID=CAMNT_0004070841 /DNA_START=57 /DNA_END=1649 /DNA_ORIENTATION=-